jgi:hypothetical protein
MRRIYIAGPYRAETAWKRKQNIARAAALGLEVCKLGATAFVPHKNTEDCDGELPDEFWLAADMEWLRVSDAVLLTSDWGRSAGAIEERETALILGIPVFDNLKDLDEWLTQ